MAPSGETVAVSSAPLDGTPFRDFPRPGIILFVMLGLVPTVVCYARYTRRWWGWIASLGVVGAILVCVLVEVIVGFNRPTCYLNLGTAGAVLILAGHPTVRHERPDPQNS
jgi:hypothetical protein